MYRVNILLIDADEIHIQRIHVIMSNNNCKIMNSTTVTRDMIHVMPRDEGLRPICTKRQHQCYNVTSDNALIKLLRF